MGQLLEHHCSRWSWDPITAGRLCFRSDNAKEFIGEAVQYINNRLEICHLTGPAYHPQAQGAIERLHRKMNELVRGMVENADPAMQKSWLEWIPFVEGHMRCMKMEVLGGRSPMEVVMGISPQLPATLRAGLTVEAVSVSDYVKDLLEYLRVTYVRVKQRAEQLQISREGAQKGSPGAQRLAVGDLVALKKAEPPKGQSRFGWTVEDRILRVGRVLGGNTYELVDVATGESAVSKEQPNRFPADRLVRLDMPEWEQPLPEGSPQHLEIYDEYSASWDRAIAEKWAVDGRVFVRFSDSEKDALWLDLTTCRYRWTTGPIASAGQDADPEEALAEH